VLLVASQALAEGRPRIAPSSPAFERFVDAQKKKAPGVEAITASGHGLGYIPEPVSSAHLAAPSPRAGSGAPSFLPPGPPSGAQTGTIDWAGYVTVDLDAPVAVTAGQRFSVVMKFTTPGYDNPLPMERKKAGYTSGATANPGETFISGSGGSWTDMNTFLEDASVCIQAIAEG
jgi:hypothetical protein